MLLFFQIVQCSIKIELINDSWTELRGEIAGPPDTPYEGGRFVLEIKVPETYPFNPPKVSKVTADRPGTNLKITFIGPLHNTHLASKYFVRNRRHLPGHIEGQLGRCDDITHSPLIAAGIAVRRRAR